MSPSPTAVTPRIQVPRARREWTGHPPCHRRPRSPHPPSLPDHQHPDSPPISGRDRPPVLSGSAYPQSAAQGPRSPPGPCLDSPLSSTNASPHASCITSLPCYSNGGRLRLTVGDPSAMRNGGSQVRQVGPRSTRSHSVRAAGPATLSGGQPLPKVRRPLPASARACEFGVRAVGCIPRHHLAGRAVRHGGQASRTCYTWQRITRPVLQCADSRRLGSQAGLEPHRPSPSCFFCEPVRLWPPLDHWGVAVPIPRHAAESGAMIEGKGRAGIRPPG